MADGSAKLSVRDYELQEPSLRRKSTVRRKRERVSVEILKAKRKSLSRQNQEMTLKPAKIFGPFKVTSFTVITLNREFNCMRRKKETFLVPLKYIDVMRSTNTDLDVAPEKRIDDYWNIDEDRRFSDSWTGFSKFTVLEGTPPKGYTWSGERLTKNQTTTRPDHVWPEALSRIGKAAQRRAKTRMVNRETETRQCQKFERNLFN